MGKNKGTRIRIVTKKNKIYGQRSDKENRYTPIEQLKPKEPGLE